MNPFFASLADASLRVIPAAAGVGLVLRVGRVRAGSMRHAAWAAVMCGMLLMPILPYGVPKVEVPLDLPPGTFPVLPAAAPTPGRADRAKALPTVTLAEIPETPPRRRTDWELILGAVYGFGLLAMLLRLLAGWRSARRLAASSLVHELPGGEMVYESPLLVTPLTVGVLAPRITLPRGWRDWPAEKLRAVLAHERAHVRRRDPAVRLLSQVNRCLFWFHPLAWWLDRKLADCAEHACDEAGILALGEGRKYAEVLLDLAETVRRSGGRFSRQFSGHGVGIGGDGGLHERIDRALRGGLPIGVSGWRKAAVAAGCASAIFLVAACSRRLAPLADDPKVAADRAAEEKKQALYQAAVSMTSEQVAATEAALQNRPDDLEARKKLIVFYWRSGQGKLGEVPTVKALRRHILWLIEHHPEDELAASRETLISPSDQDQLSDPAGYALARKAWLAQAEREGASAKILGNAASFLSVADKPLAEQLFLRAQRLDPKGPWSASLGRLYFEVLLGSTARMPVGVIRSVSMADAKGVYADTIRRKLAQSNDAELLTAAGEALVMRGQSYYRQGAINFDPTALGKSYLERALTLDPQFVRAHQLMFYTRLPGRLKTSTYEQVAQLPPAERFVPLARLAQGTYNRGEIEEYYKKDAAAAEAERERSAQYAREALQLAAAARSDPDYGTGWFQANMTLGMVAIRKRDQKSAVRYLLEASRAPASEELAYVPQYFGLKLPSALMELGERTPVIDFLERYAEVSIAQKTYLLESASLIRRGQKPPWYYADQDPSMPGASRIR